MDNSDGMAALYGGLHTERNPNVDPQNPVVLFKGAPQKVPLIWETPPHISIINGTRTS